MSMLRENHQLDSLIVSDLMIPGEKVAHVQLNNPLEHALLVLVKSGYYAVPVLDVDGKLIGSINKTIILDQIIGLEHYETDRLSELRVHEVMDDALPSIPKDASFIEGLNTVINAPFACVIDEEGVFDGILTRRAILKELKRDYYQQRMQSKN